jgi:2-methylaconitate cis-trans-isomerase PrpF
MPQGVIVIKHPAGQLETRISIRPNPDSDIPEFDRAGIVRTARPLLAGVVHILGGVRQRPERAA